MSADTEMPERQCDGAARQGTRFGAGLLINAGFVLGFVVVMMAATAVLVVAADALILFWVPVRALAKAVGRPVERYLTWWSRTSAGLGLPMARGARARGALATLVVICIRLVVAALFLACLSMLALLTMIVWLVPVLGWISGGRSWRVFSGLWTLSGQMGFSVQVGFRGVRVTMPEGHINPAFSPSDPVEAAERADELTDLAEQRSLQVDLSGSDRSGQDSQPDQS